MSCILTGYLWFQLSKLKDVLSPIAFASHANVEVDEIREKIIDTAWCNDRRLLAVATKSDVILLYNLQGSSLDQNVSICMM